MALTALRTSAHPLRLALPPSLGSAVARERAERLQEFLCRSLGKDVEVPVAASYESLTKDLLAGRVDAAWAPPFVCARVEAMGVRVLVRGIRNGSASYRAALLCRAGAAITLEKLGGLRAAWVDRDSVAGYLLPTAFLRAKGIDPHKTLFSQSFAGSYRAALEQVLEGGADLTSVFCPMGEGEALATSGVAKVAPELSGKFTAVALTDESPNDGVAVAMAAHAGLVSALERCLLGLRESTEGTALLTEIFNADGFEPAPRMGYRALYRVALASL
jgi:phosphonate transport system substrate-binding protein